MNKTCWLYIALEETTVELPCFPFSEVNVAWQMESWRLGASVRAQWLLVHEYIVSVFVHLAEQNSQ